MGEALAVPANSSSALQREKEIQPCMNSATGFVPLLIFVVLGFENSTVSGVLLRSRRLCDIYEGRWVADASYPLYDWTSCPYISGEFDCQRYGRPDSQYLHYRWKPNDCNIPRFDATAFLEKLRGKTVMFVGDSLARNQYQSMICLVQSVMQVSAVSFVENFPFSSFKSLEYGISVIYHRAPYLVDIEKAAVGGTETTVLRLDSIENNARAWRNADVLVFHSGHWWTHSGSHRGWNLIQNGNSFYTDVDRMLAYEKGMMTWANWVDCNIHSGSSTRVVFASYSPSHTSPPEKHNCYGVSEPLSRPSIPDTAAVPGLFRVAENVVRKMRTPVEFLNITFMSLLRKDAHPSVYSRGSSGKQSGDPAVNSDCTHWCLPGLPDIWNELLYSSLISDGLIHS